MANETPPPFMANAILNFHFDFPHTSLIDVPTPQVLQGFYLRICKAAVNHQCLQVKANVTHENGYAQFGGLD